MNLETKITIYKFTPQVFTLTHYLIIASALSLLFREVATLSAYGRKLAVAPGVQGQQIRHFPPLGTVLHVGNRRMDHDQ